MKYCRTSAVPKTSWSLSIQACAADSEFREETLPVVFPHSLVRVQHETLFLMKEDAAQSKDWTKPPQLNFKQFQWQQSLMFD